jgi:hypothetical protein
MPHSKPESKMERKDDLFVVNEVSLIVNICSKCELNKLVCHEKVFHVMCACMLVLRQIYITSSSVL